MGQKEIVAERLLGALTWLPKALKLGPQPITVAGSGVWLQAHPLDELWPFMHCSVRIMPSDQARWLAEQGALMVNRDAEGRAWFTLGAGPEEGKLMNGFNRPRDVEAPKVYAERLAVGGTEEDALIQRLLDAAGRFKNDQNFAPLPGRKSHNCNAYVAGLLRQAQAPVPKRLPARFYLPGFGHPLPESEFHRAL